jgi:predicted RNase H-like nuclease (RuvC/YqgF family)
MEDEMNTTLSEGAVSEASQEELAMNAPMKEPMRSPMKQSMKSRSEEEEMEMDEEDKKQEMSKREKMSSKNAKEKMSQNGDAPVAVSTEQLLSQIQALSKQMDELSSAYQARLKEADERLNQALSINAQLEARLKETEARTEYLTSQAYAVELSNRKAEYIRKGVPPFIVNKVFDIIQSNPSQQIRLSNGEQATLQSQLEEILSQFPSELRVSFQQFSSTATPAPKAENPFRKAGIIK